MQTSELTLHNFWLSVRIAGYQGCMALLLDTSVLEPDQRADAFVDAMGRARFHAQSTWRTRNG